MTSLTDLSTLFSQKINKHAPLKRISRRQPRFKKKPWLTKGILHSIKKRRFKYKKRFLLGNNTEKTFFPKYSNRLTKIIRLVKKLYFQPA